MRPSIAATLNQPPIRVKSLDLHATTHCLAGSPPKSPGRESDLLIKVLPQRLPACGGYAWGLGVHADVVQDLPYLYALSNERDQPHLPAAHWAQQRKDLVDAGDQDHP